MKTFPIRLDSDFHAKMIKAAYEDRLSLQKYIVQAIEEKMKRTFEKGVSK